MMKTFVTDVFGDKGRFVQWLIKPALGLVLLALVAGCQTKAPQPSGVKEQTTAPPEIITLREGDVVKFHFPAPQAWTPAANPEGRPK